MSFLTAPLVRPSVDEQPTIKLEKRQEQQLIKIGQNNNDNNNPDSPNRLNDRLKPEHGWMDRRTDGVRFRANAKETTKKGVHIIHTPLIMFSQGQGASHQPHLTKEIEQTNKFTSSHTHQSGSEVRAPLRLSLSRRLFCFCFQVFTHRCARRVTRHLRIRPLNSKRNTTTTTIIRYTNQLDSGRTPGGGGADYEALKNFAIRFFLQKGQSAKSIE